MSSFTVVPYTQNGSLDSVIDQRAFLHSSAFEKIFKFKQKDIQSAKNLAGYLKVSNGKRKIYLKYQSLNGVKDGEVQLSYAVRCGLGVVVGKNTRPKEVEIRKSCWFYYYCCNSDAGIKVPFNIACMGLVVTFFSFIIGILSFFI